jgi:hypothetical protein
MVHAGEFHHECNMRNGICMDADKTCRAQRKTGHINSQKEAATGYKEQRTPVRQRRGWRQ